MTWIHGVVDPHHGFAAIAAMEGRQSFMPSGIPQGREHQEAGEGDAQAGEEPQGSAGRLAALGLLTGWRHDGLVASAGVGAEAILVRATSHTTP